MRALVPTTISRSTSSGRSSASQSAIAPPIDEPPTAAGPSSRAASQPAYAAIESNPAPAVAVAGQRGRVDLDPLARELACHRVPHLRTAAGAVQQQHEPRHRLRLDAERSACIARAMLLWAGTDRTDAYHRGHDSPVPRCALGRASQEVP